MEENMYHWKNYEDFKLMFDKVLKTEFGSSSEKHSSFIIILEKVIRMKDISCLQLLMEKAPFLTEEKNDQGQTPLLRILYSVKYDASFDLLTMAQMLLQTNPKIATIADNHGVTPLHLVATTAVCRCNGESSCDTENVKFFQFAQLLLDNGADVNAEDDSKHTPLISAIKQIRNNHKETPKVVKFLIAHGAKLYLESGYNVLCHAVNNNVQIMSYLLQQDSTAINLPDLSGSTPLHEFLSTFYQDDLEMINLLFSHGLDVSNDTKCILIASEHNCCFEISETLIAHGAPFDSYTKFEKKLILCEYCTSSENVSKMLQWGTYPLDVNWTNVWRDLVQKCRGDTLEAVKLCVAAGADPTFMTKFGHTLLNTACGVYSEMYKEDMIPLIEYLCSLPKYADLNTKSAFDLGYHPQITILEKFHKMNRQDSVRIMKCLLKTNTIAPEYCVRCALDFSIMIAQVFEPYFLTVLGSLLNTEDIRVMLDDDTKMLMQLMFDAGLKVPDAECDLVTTALTALLAVKLPYNPDLYLQEDDNTFEDDSEQNEGMNIDIEDPDPADSEDDWEDVEDMEENSSYQESDEEEDRFTVAVAREKVKELMELAKQFIEAGVNVESMTLKLANTDYTDDSFDNYGPSYRRQILNSENAIDCFKQMMGVPCTKPATEVRMEFRAWSEPLRKKLWLPDALWVSFLSGNGPAVKLLLPHWSAPPLALLVFMPPKILLLFLSNWYKILSKFGGIPHGTEVYKRLASIIEEHEKSAADQSNLEIDESVWTSFQELHSSPLSLCALSKYAVRAAYAERASKSDTSLPRIMAAISPPGLLSMLTQQD